MKLTDVEFKRYKELLQRLKSKKLTDSESKELAELDSKKKDRAQNDPYWYVKGDKSILNDVASRSFGTFPGQGLRLGIADHKTDEFANTVQVVAHFIPGVGTTASDAINVAGRKNYTYVRSKNSGAKNYEAPDLIIYNTGYMYCLLGLAVIRRLVGSVKYFSTRNKSVPMALVRAQGFEYRATINQLPMIRARLNLLTRKLSSLSVPKGQTLINRWIFLVENIFCDHADDKAVNIVVVPAELLQYAPNTVREGGALLPNYDTVIDEATQQNPTDYLDQIEKMIDALIADDDSAMMSGDQMKAYNDDHVIISETPEEFEVKPVYSEQFLLQLHNARIMPNALYFDYVNLADDPVNLQSGFAIKQKNGIVVCDPYLLMPANEESGDVDASNTLTGSTLLDIWKEHPTPEDVMEMTRFNYVIDIENTTISNAGENEGYVPLLSCGTEIITLINCFYFDATGSLEVAVVDDQVRAVGVNLTAVLWALNPLDWHPAIYRRTTTQGISGNSCSVTVPDGLLPICDVSNYTTIRDSDYVNLNKLAVYAELSLSEI